MSDYLYQGLADLGQSLSEGASEYINRRREDEQLSAQLDTLASMMSGLAQQYPKVLTESDKAVIDKIAKAPGSSLQQKKAALADAMLWLQQKSGQIEQESAKALAQKTALSLEPSIDRFPGLEPVVGALRAGVPVDEASKFLVRKPEEDLGALAQVALLLGIYGGELPEDMKNLLSEALKRKFGIQSTSRRDDGRAEPKGQAEQEPPGALSFDEFIKWAKSRGLELPATKK